MARITICDLCKNQVRDKAGLGKLSLIVYLDKLKRDVEAEICRGCSRDLFSRLKAEDVIAPREPTSPLVKTRGEAVGLVVDSLLETGLAVASKPQESASGEATEELLEDEIVSIPSARDLRKGSKDVRALNAEIVKERGTCLHQFKRFEDGAIICIDAPLGVQGEFASVRGCGKKLAENEV